MVIMCWFFSVCILFVALACSYFFFFKQKTAYDMLISDWSSDVCSSDLFDRVFSVGMFEHVGVRNYRAYFETVHRCLRPHGLTLLHTKIGRASCRESVCQYV